MNKFDFDSYFLTKKVKMPCSICGNRGHNKKTCHDIHTEFLKDIDPKVFDIRICDKDNIKEDMEEKTEEVVEDGNGTDIGEDGNETDIGEDGNETDVEEDNENKIKSCIIIQEYYKLYNNKKRITPSRYQTKDWRKSQDWYNGGKHNECEKYQRNIIEEITNQSCPKSSVRINRESYELVKESRPMTLENAFMWTEDFDGMQVCNDYKLYYNFKMVADNGGAQTRSLREVAYFIEHQLEYKFKYINKKIYFINILDGDTSYKLYNKFQYILNKLKYKYVKNFVYIGDTYNFVNWFHSINVQ